MFQELFWNAGVNFFITAEGNIDNQNVSGIAKRRRDDTIGCFLRIPEGLSIRRLEM